jgi:hypothetical protein
MLMTEDQISSVQKFLHPYKQWRKRNHTFGKHNLYT